MSKTTSWILYEVHAGRKAPTRPLCTGCACTHPEEKCRCADECCAKPVDCDAYEPRDDHYGLDRYDTDPEHHFFIVAPDDFDLGVAMAPAFRKFNTKSSNDLPKPFNMVPVEGVEIEATAETVQALARPHVGDAEVLVGTKALYREMVAEGKKKLNTGKKVSHR